MRRLTLALVASTALIMPAFAETRSPSKVEFGRVPANALVSGDVIGLTATNDKNESVGEIKDLVIDHERLVGYVISVGGFLGIGDHYVEVEPKSVAIDYDAGAKKWKAVVNATKDELKAAPEFNYSDRTKH